MLPDAIDAEGIARIQSAFCLPAEITHGSFYNLLSKKPDYLFLPQVAQLPVPNVPTYRKACVFVQGEPYYLRTTFRSELEQSTTAVLSPILQMDTGYEAAEAAVCAMAKGMGFGEQQAGDAWRYACGKQLAFEQELQAQGAKALAYCEAHPETFGIVLFGRPYSAFSADASKGIPHKVASRGFIVIPFDMLPAADFPVDDKMFWAMGAKNMKAAQFVKKRSDLFGFYVTNFSCGPDSFLLGYFRRLMGSKPSLTLEVDQHTADAGIDTRVEAALDIMTSYRRIEGLARPDKTPFRPARVLYGKETTVISSSGKQYSLTDPAVEIVLPSMGKYTTEAIGAVLRSRGINARALPIISGKKCEPITRSSASFAFTAMIFFCKTFCRWIFSSMVLS